MVLAQVRPKLYIEQQQQKRNWDSKNMVWCGVRCALGDWGGGSAGEDTPGRHRRKRYRCEMYRTLVMLSASVLFKNANRWGGLRRINTAYVLRLVASGQLEQMVQCEGVCAWDAQETYN